MVFVFSESKFVAINSVQCRPEYVPRFKELFFTRAGAIDRSSGFLGLYVLEPEKEGAPYLIVSHWQDEPSFIQWTKSAAFAEGHQRAFADLRKAREQGEVAPMHSSFEKYAVMTT